jgi:DNA-binding IclR family transcriptional regulator
VADWVKLRSSRWGASYGTEDARLGTRRTAIERKHDVKEPLIDDDGTDSGDANAKYRAPALEKGLDILQLLAGEREPLTLSTICQRLGRSQGEIFRMVQVLQTRGFVDQDPKSDGYYLTDLLFSMAMRQPATQGLVEIAIPVMRGLAADIGQSCHLALHSRGEIVVVARMESMEQIGFSVRVGYRRSINLAVSGLTLLAFQPEDVRARWLELIEPKPTAAELKKFVATADEVRKRGFGRAASSFVDGVTDISAPVIRGDRAAAALTVPYIKTTQSRVSVAGVIEKLKIAANQISEQLAEGDNRA